MITKGSALYIHAPKGDYDCDDCPFYIMPTRRCVLHGAYDHINPEDSCGYFVPGPSGIFGDRPLGFVTPAESGLVRNVNEAGCKRCRNWLPDSWACMEVDKDSPGDDPGMIHPDSCCCLWVEDPTRGPLPSEAFERQGY